MNKLLLFCMIPVLAACQSVQPYVDAYLNDLNQKLQQNRILKGCRLNLLQTLSRRL